MSVHGKSSMSTLLLVTLYAVGSAVPSVGCAQTNGLPFVNPTLQPTTVSPGSGGFTLTVNGSGFVSGATVNWNSSPRATTFVGTDRVTAVILASDVSQAGTARVSVTNPGGATSNTDFLNVASTVPSVVLSTPAGYLSASGGFSLPEGDFNGDGILDLALDTQAGISILLGNGDGTFRDGVTLIPTEIAGTLSVGDFNGDGKLDLVVAEQNSVGGNPLVAVYLGSGDGTFQSPIDTSLPNDSGAFFALGDFNRDGKLDVAMLTGTSSGTLQVTMLLGNGDGTLKILSGPSAGPQPEALAIGDFNGDGELDLAIGNDGGGVGPATVYLYYGNGDGTFQSPVLFPLETDQSCVLTAVDLNGDGLLDLAALDGTSLVALLNNGSGGFSYGPEIAANGEFVIAAQDFNDDGKVDVATGNDGSVSILLGNGDGSFQPYVSYTNFLGAPFALTVGDFNGDGRQDVAVEDDLNYAVSVLLEQATPIVEFSPGSLNFSNQLVGTGSSAQQATMTNGGNEPLTISKTVASPNFSERNNCGSGVAAGVSCTITVGFRPAQVGTINGSVAVTDNAPGSPQVISLSGVGAAFRLSPTSIGFGSVPVGQTSAPQNVTITNVAKTAQPLTSIVITGTYRGEFAETNTCGPSLAAGAQCAVSITFSPKYRTIASASLQITGGGAIQLVALSGKGT